MFDPLSWFDKMTPDGNSPEKLQKWRNRIAFSATAFWILLLTSPLTMPILGDGRYMQKAVADEINAGIQRELSKLNASVTTLADSLAAAETQRAQDNEQRALLERQQTIRDIRTQLYQTQRDACKASGELRSLLNRQVADLRSNYRVLTGDEYPDIPCSNF